MRSHIRRQWWSLLVLAAMVGLLLPSPATAAVAAVLLDVPWRSQIDGLPDQREDAGPASLGMVLAAYGRGVSTGELRYDPTLNLWHGTQALAAGMAKYGDPLQAYARHYNPGGQVQGERVMDWYRHLRALGAAAQQAEPSPGPGAADGPSAGVPVTGGLW